MYMAKKVISVAAFDQMQECLITKTFWLKGCVWFPCCVLQCREVAHQSQVLRNSLREKYGGESFDKKVQKVNLFNKLNLGNYVSQRKAWHPVNGPIEWQGTSLHQIQCQHLYLIQKGLQIVHSKAKTNCKFSLWYLSCIQKFYDCI